MVNLKVEELQGIMAKQNNTRHISIISHGYGYSALVDSLAIACGINTQETATHDGENGIPIKSTGIPLYHEMTDGNKYLINLINSPEDDDLEMKAVFRITDGSLVVVDCTEGICANTETLLRHALGERVKPVLIVNNMDSFIDLQVSGEEAYQRLFCLIENVNNIISIYEDALDDVQLQPEKGTVAFAAGLHGWAFTVSSFAKLYASRFGVHESVMMERLWGENFFDISTKEWSTKNTGSATCKRGFVQFCYDPIMQIISTCLTDQKDKLWPILLDLRVVIKDEEKELMGKALMEHVMQTLLPASAALVDMMIFHLPSPVTAQKYRVENLYEGPLDDIYATAIRICDSEGPLMLYVSKMIPTPEKSKFFAFGRIFSGKVKTGMKVRIINPNCVPGQDDLTVEQTVICMGMKDEYVDCVSSGNTAAISGFDKFISSNFTLTNKEEVSGWTIGALDLTSNLTTSVQLQNDLELEQCRILLQEAEAKNQKLARKLKLAKQQLAEAKSENRHLKSAKERLSEVKSENSKLCRQMEKSKKLQAALSCTGSTKTSTKVMLLLSQCHDVFLCANEVGATELLDRLSEPDSDILCILEIPGATNDPVWDYAKLNKLSPFGKVVFLGMIEDLYRLHRNGLCLSGKFSLKDFFWTVNQKVKLGPETRKIVSKKSRVKINMTTKDLPI